VITIARIADPPRHVEPALSNITPTDPYRDRWSPDIAFEYIARFPTKMDVLRFPRSFYIASPAVIRRKMITASGDARRRPEGAAVPVGNTVSF
jgi:hypothetical protein